MAIILNIDTSSEPCSVALTDDGVVTLSRCDDQPMRHATVLSGFIKDALDSLRERSLTLDAVAVSLGPGSYTGLRIGMSEAKGLAYALGAKLIGVHTLKLLAVQAMFDPTWEGDELFIPMLDARRMEVYTAAYSPALDTLLEPRPLILEPGCLDTLLAQGPAVICGPGARKARKVIAEGPGVRFLDDLQPSAAGMTALAEQAWQKGDFLDIAYATPFYLKEFQASKPRDLLHSLQ